jgi:hypothetical protein
MPGLRSARHWLSASASWLSWSGGGRARSCRPERRRRPRLEALEDRTLPAVLTVLNTNDSGDGSLRGEIAAAAGGDTIVFDHGLTGQTIALTSGQVEITKDLTIDATGASNLTVARSSAAGTPDFGIFKVDLGTTVALSGLTISNGKAAVQGGGIFNQGTLSLSASTLSGNSSGPFGGGVENTGTLTVSNCVFSGNTAVEGGGIDNAGTLTVRTCTLSGNTASTGGGGGLSNRGGAATLLATTVSGNTADVGSALINSDGHPSGEGDLALTDCTVSGNINTKLSVPGIILNLSFQGTAKLTLTSCTVAGNTGLALENIAGGTGSAPTSYRDTIFARNTSTPNVFNMGGTVTSLGHNLSDTHTGDLTGPGDLPNTDPLLGPLADNGGPTQTMALLPGSPALDAGDATDAPDFDQRGTGFARVVNGAIDIGAFEDQLVVTPPSANPQGVVAGTAASFDLGSFSDLSPAGSWAATVDWGDTSADTFPTSPQGPLGTKAHTYAQVGSYTVTVTVANAGGDSNQATFQVDVGAPPAVTQQPASQTVNAGQAVSFTAAASGTPAPTVQWLVSADAGKTFRPLGGATSGTLSFTATDAQNGYEYEAVFSNGAGSATTAPATLTVDFAPAVTTQPAGVAVLDGQPVTFSAAAAANPLADVQWQVSSDGGTTWSPFGGATSPSLSFTATAAQNGNEYEAVFSNSAGSATTAPATLTVDYAPTVTTQPTDVTVNAGQTATFTAAAGGNPAPTVQWQASSDGGKTFSPLSGATSATLTLTGVLASMNGNQYEAVFMSSVGSATTSAATLTVAYAPAITQQPASQTVSPGQTATFTAAATANPAATVQWQVSTDGGKNFADVVGATSATLSFTAGASQNGSQYRAVFRNSVGSATSAAATLGVRVTPVFGNLSSPTLIFGTASVSLSGTVAAGGLIPSGQVVSVTVNGATRDATIHADGSFAATFATQALPAGSYAIAYSFAGGGAFLPAAGNGTLTVTYAVAAAGPAVPSTRHGLPLWFAIRVNGAAGRSAGSAALTVTAVGLAPAASPSALHPARPAGVANPGNRLLFIAGNYVYILDTTGLPAGKHLFFFTVHGDPVQHSVLFQLT